MRFFFVLLLLLLLLVELIILKGFVFFEFFTGMIWNILILFELESQLLELIKYYGTRGDLNSII